MKSVLCLLLVTVVIFAQRVPQHILTEWHLETAEFHSECMCATGVDPVLAERVFVHQEFKNIACLKCYLRCIARKREMLDHSDVALPEMWDQRVTNVTIEIATDCVQRTQNITDPCDKVNRIALCFVEHLAV